MEFMNEKRLAIITARGGSKRIPKKNIKEFMGKPMLAYAIEAAKESDLFDTIMVSTDAEDIANVARLYGADVPFMRSERNSSDYATTADVIEEVIVEYESRGLSYNEICCLYPCVPFLKGSTLTKAHALLKSVEAVMPVCRFPVPIEWAFQIREGRLVAREPDKLVIRSQDLETMYYDAGMFYYFYTDAFRKYKALSFPNTAPYIMDESECQDIDTMEDWHIAEIKYRLLYAKEEES